MSRPNISIVTASKIEELRSKIVKKLEHLKRNRFESVEHIKSYLQPFHREIEGNCNEYSDDVPSRKTTSSKNNAHDNKKFVEDLHVHEASDNEHFFDVPEEELEEKEEQEDDDDVKVHHTKVKKVSLSESVLDKSNFTTDKYASVLSSLSPRERLNIDASELGLQNKGKKLYLGKTPVTIRNNELIIDDEEVRTHAQQLKLPFIYRLTPGLVNLIFQVDPSEYNVHDLRKYQKLAYATNLFSCTRQKTLYIRSPKWKLVEDFYKVKQAGKGLKSATPSLLFKKYSTTNLKYQYYNCPNKLVNRLRLLYNAKYAGHTNTEFEIRTILSELRETGVIR